MRLFVTGGTGFIGSALVAEAISAGHELALLTRNPDAWRLRPWAGRFRHVEGDLSDMQPVTAALEEFRPEAVVHLAWAGVGGNDRNDPVQIRNIGWSADLLVAAQQAGARHFLSTGSQAEYGPKSGIVSPNDQTAPTTLYGESKLATCRILTRLASLRQIRFSWLRVFSTYGATDHPYWMIPGLIRDLLRGERPALTEGRQKWDYLHVSDAARALLLVATSETAGGVYNLGSGSAPPLRDTVSLIRDSIDPNLPLGFGDVPYRPDQVMHLEADIDRLRAELGWSPRVTLAEGLADTVAWYRANPWIFGT